MKNKFKILLLCIVMMFAMALSTFAKTNNERTILTKTKTGSMVTLVKDFKGEIKSIQFHANQNIKPKMIQELLTQIKAKCVNVANVDLTPCEEALIVVAIATVAAITACAPGPNPACAIALIAQANAIRLAAQACKGIIEIEVGPEASNKKLNLLKKNKFQFAT